MPDRHDVLATEARECANTLGLRDWTIIVYEEPPPEGVDAQAEVDDARHAIVLRFRDDYDELPAPQRKYLLVHELLHAHMQLPATYVLGLRDELGRSTWNVFWRGYESEVERLVDRLASAVAPLLVDESRTL